MTCPECHCEIPPRTTDPRGFVPVCEFCEEKPADFSIIDPLTGGKAWACLACARKIQP